MNRHAHSLAENARTIVLVTLVAVLVWIFAEAESLTTRTIRPEILFETEDGTSLVLEIDDPAWRERPSLTIEGSTSAVAAVELATTKPIRLRPGMEGIPTAPGEYTIDLRTALRDAAELTGKGVTVARTDPAAVRLRVDQLEERSLRVEADTSAFELEAPAEVKPAFVKVRLPAAEAAKLTEGAVARARVSAESLSKLVPGRKETVSGVPIELPPGLVASPRVRVDQSRAEVQLTLRTRTASLTLPSVPVYVSLAAVESGRWDVTIPEEDRFITDVKITGPSDAVDRVRRGEFRVTALVVLSFDDLERGIASKEITFCELPTPLTFKADNSKVRVKIQRREKE